MAFTRCRLNDTKPTRACKGQSARLQGLSEFLFTRQTGRDPELGMRTAPLSWGAAPLSRATLGILPDTSSSGSGQAQLRAGWLFFPSVSPVSSCHCLHSEAGERRRALRDESAPHSSWYGEVTATHRPPIRGILFRFFRPQEPVKPSCFILSLNVSY